MGIDKMALARVHQIKGKVLDMIALHSYRGRFRPKPQSKDQKIFDNRSSHIRLLPTQSKAKCSVCNGISDVQHQWHGHSSDLLDREKMLTWRTITNLSRTGSLLLLMHIESARTHALKQILSGPTGLRFQESGSLLAPICWR